MPRWLAHLLLVVGWFLAPGLAWGASYAAFWCAARLGLGAGNPLRALGAAALVAGAAGLAVTLLWVRYMRHLPHLLAHHMAPRRSEAHTVPTQE